MLHTHRLILMDLHLLVERVGKSSRNYPGSVDANTKDSECMFLALYIDTLLTSRT